MRAVVCLLVVAVGFVAAAGYFGSETLADQMRRYPDVFDGLDDNGRPPATNAMNILVIGSDTQTDALTTGTEATSTDRLDPGRSDLMMLVRIDKNFSQATVMSFPRDSWVSIPGHGKAKLNASFAIGGPPLLVSTVEGITGIRVDHFAIIDFTGFQRVIDAVGGVDVNVDKPTASGSLTLHPGTNHLDGKQALSYARQHIGLPRGDFDRMRRYQSVVQAYFVKVSASGLVFGSARIHGFLSELTQWITVDDTLTNDELRSIALLLPGLSFGDTTFLTAPVSGLGRERGQSVVYLNTDQCGALWRAFADGDITTYLRTHPECASTSGPGGVR